MLLKSLLVGDKDVTIKLGAWVINYTHVKQWNGIIHPCHNFNGGLVKPPLKLLHG